MEKIGLNEMKIYVILLSCLCGSLAITVHQETPPTLTKNTKEYKTTLKDIRLVPINQPQSLQKPIRGRNKESSQFVNLQNQTEQPKLSSQNLQIKPRGEKKKSRINQVSRVGTAQQTLQADQSHINYMQKMANQLYLAQKHASVLSDYQKFILSQDPNVKTFVLGQSPEERTPKPFIRPSHKGRSISVQTPRTKYVTTEALPTAKAESKKIVVVTPRTQTTSTVKLSNPQNDHSPQATHVKYVTLAPQSLTHYMATPEPYKKVTLQPYYTPQPYTYYDLAETQKPQVATVEVPAILSFDHGSYSTPHHHLQQDEHEETHQHHADPKYEFMYKIKDHEKNNHFGHMESRTDKTTYGYYYVHLPDGRLETVKYWADKTGYHAKVDYQGEAKHPPTEHKLHSHNLFHH